LLYPTNLKKSSEIRFEEKKEAARGGGVVRRFNNSLAAVTAVASHALTDHLDVKKTHFKPPNPC
jgi:predicted rRNA methylase YqxC with S4 and FtsJ domains